ncbi:hypothetical protein, partial [Cupriavidus basilensis]|uniref:hypothetical protein n=1 Tax=Cupriavidus basilensis TaxID=68895 RepID=UPI001ED93D69
YDIPLRGLPVTFLCAAKKTNEKKAALPGAEQSGCFCLVGCVVRPGVLAGLCHTGLEGIVIA